MPQPRPWGSKPAASHTLRISEISLVTLGRLWRDSSSWRSVNAAWKSVFGRYILTGGGRCQEMV